jgi:hypothetical protein
MTTSPQKIDWTPIFKYLDDNFASKEDIKQLKEQITHLPTKDQFYKKMDKWMKATTTHDLEKSAHKRAHERLTEHLAHSPIL